MNKKLLGIAAAVLMAVSCFGTAFAVQPEWTEIAAETENNAEVLNTNDELTLAKEKIASNNTASTDENNPTPITLGQWVTGTIGNGKEEYYYSFTLSKPGYIDIIAENPHYGTEHNDGVWYLCSWKLEYLGNNSWNDIFSISGSSTKSNEQRRGVGAGTHTVNVRADQQFDKYCGTKYKFKIVFTPHDYWEQEPNYYFKTDDYFSFEPYELATPVKIGYNYYGNSPGYFSFNVTTPGYFNIGVVQDNASTQVSQCYLYDSNGNDVGHKYNVYINNREGGVHVGGSEWKYPTAYNSGNFYLPAGKYYFFLVNNFDYDGNWRFRINSVNAAVSSLSAPTDVKVAVNSSSNKINISWKSVNGATSYEVWRSTAANGTYTKIATVTGTSRIDNNVQWGKTYYYKIKAKNGSMTSPYSSAGSCMLSVAAPTNVKIINRNAYSLRVQWNEVAGATAYEIWRATSYGGTYTKIATVSGRNYYINSQLQVSRPYYYKIRAKFGNNVGAYTKFVGGRTLPITQSAISVTKRNSTSATIKWAKSSGASGYEVWRSTSVNGTYTRVAAVSGISRVDSGLKSGQAYYYKVRAYTTYGGVRHYGRFTVVRGVRM